MRTSLALAALVSAVLIAACGSSGSTGNQGSSSGGGSGSSGGSSGSSNGSSGGGSGGSGSSSGTLPPIDAAAPDGDVLMNDSGNGTQSYTVQFGPIMVKPSQENTQCIVVSLHNPAPIHVGQIHDLLGTASHHMILYKLAAGTAEQPTPFDCQPFQSALNPSMGNPLIISQKADDTLTLPQNVAFTLDANQIVRLEMHYINANPSQAVTLVTTSTLTTIPDSQYKYDASFLFIGTTNVSIPPNSTWSTNQQYFQVPSNYNSSNFWAITGHEHHLGTKVQIWSATSSSDPGSLVYTSTSWSDPPVTTFSPPIRVPAGGGFKFQCDYDNTTSQTVSFGESANNEMCFFWSYYWPSQGAQVCFADLGVCCPGNPACAALP
jgi:hypothetical protein